MKKDKQATNEYGEGINRKERRANDVRNRKHTATKTVIPEGHMTEHTYQRVVGKVIAHFRRMHDKTQREIADELGCAQSTIVRIESGDVAPSIYQVARLAILFKCKVTDIVVELRNET